MDVHVSTMTGKLEGFRAINSNTRSNPFCLKMYENSRADVICRSCYSHEMLKAYRANTVPALQRNTDVLSQPWNPDDVIKLAGKWPKKIPARRICSNLWAWRNSQRGLCGQRNANHSREPTSALLLVVQAPSTNPPVLRSERETREPNSGLFEPNN
jgi:hypothetical protein